MIGIVELKLIFWEVICDISKPVEEFPSKNEKPKSDVACAIVVLSR